MLTPLQIRAYADLASAAESMRRAAEAMERMAKAGEDVAESLARFTAAGEKVEDIPIEELDLMVRPYNVLKRERVNTIGDLIVLNQNQLFDMRNMGVNAVDDIKAKLAIMGLELAPVVQ